MGVNMSSLSPVESLGPNDVAASSGHRATASGPHVAPPVAPRNSPTSLPSLTAGERQRRVIADPPLEPDTPSPTSRPSAPYFPQMSQVATTLGGSIGASPPNERHSVHHCRSPYPPADVTSRVESTVIAQRRAHQPQRSPVSSSDDDDLELSDPSLQPSSYPSWQQEEIDRFGSLQVPSLCHASQTSAAIPEASADHCRHHRHVATTCEDDEWSMSDGTTSPL